MKGCSSKQATRLFSSGKRAQHLCAVPHQSYTPLVYAALGAWQQHIEGVFCTVSSATSLHLAQVKGMQLVISCSRFWVITGQRHGKMNLATTDKAMHDSFQTASLRQAISPRYELSCSIKLLFTIKQLMQDNLYLHCISLHIQGLDVCLCCDAQRSSLGQSSCHSTTVAGQDFKLQK